MPNSDLEKYIQSAREQKFSDEDIKQHLLKLGWDEQSIQTSLEPQRSTNINLPPPTVPHVGMWVAFLHVILFISLYISSFAFTGILNYAVDNLIKDPLKDTYGYGGYSLLSYFFFYLSNSEDSLRLYLAVLIVTFPIFAGLFLYLKNLILKKPFVKSLKARKVLIYLTLVGTFLILIFNLIKTIFSFLNGTTTSNSLAHVGVTLFVSGLIFTYYLFEVKEDRKTNA